MLKAFLLGFLCLGQLMATTTEDFKLLISKEQIDSRIKEVASEINREYEGKEIVLVMVMKGAIYITADLMREITVPCILEYVKASSYGLGTVSGELTLRGIEDLSLKGKHVILVDDIFDTGKTMTTIKEKLLLQEPASIKTLVLLLKNRPRTITAVPDYVLFPIEDEFVIGYGLDDKEYRRGLPGVYTK
jgi:hypoxanthine phosphoribosyltransferase